MRPKPTLYNGRHFRSRLEAQWAAFFDQLGWSWEYEPTRYATNGWLPDFVVEDHFVFEIKPVLPNQPDERWAAPSGMEFSLLVGPPAVWESGRIVGWAEAHDCGGTPMWSIRDLVDHLVDQAVCEDAATAVRNTRWVDDR